MNKTYLVLWQDMSEEGVCPLHGVVAAFRREAEALAMIERLVEISDKNFSIESVPSYG